MHDDLIAALERAAAHNEDLARTVGNQRCKADAATIRALIADLRTGNLVRREDDLRQARAKVVAWHRNCIAALKNTASYLIDREAIGKHEVAIIWLEAFPMKSAEVVAIAAAAHEASNQTEPNQ